LNRLAKGNLTSAVFSLEQKKGGLNKGIPHALRVGNGDGVELVVCVGVPGGGFDRFFAAAAEEFKKGEPEMPILVKLAAKYGIEFQSGPPS